jgi:hypothetical protein
MRTDPPNSQGTAPKPNAPFRSTELADLAGTFKERVKAKTDEAINAALKRDARSKWRDRD